MSKLNSLLGIFYINFRTTIILVFIFALCGLLLMIFVIKTSESGRDHCADVCLEKGMDFVYAPTGTAGRLADGSLSYSELYCHCIKK